MFSYTTPAINGPSNNQKNQFFSIFVYEKKGAQGVLRKVCLPQHVKLQPTSLIFSQQVLVSHCQAFNRKHKIWSRLQLIIIHIIYCHLENKVEYTVLLTNSQITCYLNVSSKKKVPFPSKLSNSSKDFFNKYCSILSRLVDQKNKKTCMPLCPVLDTLLYLIWSENRMCALSVIFRVETKQTLTMHRHF